MFDSAPNAPRTVRAQWREKSPKRTFIQHGEQIEHVWPENPAARSVCESNTPNDAWFQRILDNLQRAVTERVNGEKKSQGKKRQSGDRDRDGSRVRSEQQPSRGSCIQCV